MRKHTLVNSLKSALLAAPFMVACGGGANSGTVVIPGGGLSFPDCADGELLSVGADKTLACLPAPTGKLSPQSCLTGQVLTSENGTLKCVPVGNGTTDASIVARITMAQSQLNQIDNTVTNLKAGGGGRAKYLGVTTTKATGRIANANNTKFGLEAAAEICRGQYTAAKGAHMCTPYEMYDAVASAQIKDTDSIAKAWVYMAAWNNAASARPTGTDDEEGDAGMNDNCGSYTYPTKDQKWVGTAVSWANITYNGNRGLKFYSGTTQAPCDSSFPIACCE